MKIVIFEAESRERAAFSSLAPVAELRFVAEPLGAANVHGILNADLISTFIHSELGRGILEQLPSLKLISTRSTGYDHIDIAYCAERGITVCNVPSYGENTVAEHVFALLLALSHRLFEAAVSRALSAARKASLS